MVVLCVPCVVWGQKQPKVIHAYFFVYQASERRMKQSDGRGLERFKDENLARLFDLERAKRTVDTLMRILKFDSIDTVTYIGERCSRNSLNEAFSNLSCNDSDIVIFYYSGHGHADTRENYKLPVMSMKYYDTIPDKLRKYAVPVYSIVERLKRCGAYLNFVIADCCNDKYIRDTVLGTQNWEIDPEESPCGNSGKHPHSLTVSICAAEKGSITHLETGHYKLKKMEEIYDSLINGPCPKDYLVGNWFTELLTSEVCRSITMESNTTTMSLTTMMENIKQGLDIYVDGYHYLQRRLGRMDKYEKYNPYFEITFW